MSVIVLNTDGTVPVSPSGEVAVATDSVPCCCKGEAVSCARTFRFGRCTPVDSLCHPPGSLTEVFLCGSAATPSGQRLDSAIDAGLRPVAYRLGDCYAYEGEVPSRRPTPVTTLLPPGSCSEPICNVDHCLSYARLEPCDSTIDAGAVYVVATCHLDAGGSIVLNRGTLANPRYVCYCLNTNGARFTQSTLPPGAVVMGCEAPLYDSCCDCQSAVTPGCEFVVVPSWVGPDRYIDVRCCCGPVDYILVTGESHAISVLTDNRGTNRTEFVQRITGVTACPDGQYYLYGVTETFENGVLIESNPWGGCPRPDSGQLHTINTSCGYWVKTQEDEVKNPMGWFIGNVGENGTSSFSSGGSCDSWTETARGESRYSDGNVSQESIQFYNFSVRIFRVNGPCTDNCQSQQMGRLLAPGELKPCCGGGLLPGEIPG